MRKNIFIVDDDSSNRQLLKLMFDDNYHIQCFRTAEELFNELQVSKPQLIVMDIGLPGINGIQACKQLNASNSYKHIPIVFISGRVSPEEVKQGMAIGAADYISKPFDIEQVQHSISCQIEQNGSI